VIPTLVLVEVWHWTPLVMLIVLGGLSGLPTDPYDSALIDGAPSWQMFRFITWPLILPYVMIALVIRTIDSLKVFDTIAVISQGARYGFGNAQLLSLLAGIPILQPRLRVCTGCDLFRNHHRTLAAAVVCAAKDQMDGVKSRGLASDAWCKCRWQQVARSARSMDSVLILISPAVLVFLWMLSFSLKTEIDNIACPPIFIPNPPTLASYVEVFEKNKILLYFWNSILVTGGAVLFGLVIGVPAGYGIARARAAKAAILILIARMTPALSYLIPLFLLFQVTGLVGSIWAVVITHLVITVPIIVWIMIGYFENVPLELEDAALVDGATSWQSFRHIALPWRDLASSLARSWRLSSLGTISFFPSCSAARPRARYPLPSTTC
jgi:ABC-type glycerol-3-phosphate transport system permease component